MIWEELRGRLAQRPASPVVVEGPLKLDFAGLTDLVRTAAQALPVSRAPSGPQRILVREVRPLDVLVAVLACWSRGFVPVVLRDKTPEAVVASIRAWTRPLAETEGGRLRRPAAAGPAVPHRELRPRDEALVLCTSGTTGTPKLVALPAESVLLNASTIATALQLGPGDRVAVSTPLGYLYGLVGGCMASLWSGATCHLYDPAAPLTILPAAITRDQITVLQGPPTFFRIFLGCADGGKFPNVRLLTTGGEALAQELSEDMRRSFPSARMLFLYGMTEAGPRISHEDCSTGGGRDGCVGKPYGHFEWRVERFEGSQHPDAGRLCLRGPSMLLGYIGPDGLCSGLDDEGFHRTHDLVSLDEAGRIRFHGRIDRMFKSGGKLVNPEAVENVLRRCPGVREALCRARPHPLLGLALEAEVLPSVRDPLDPEQVAAFVRKECEPHAVPRVIRIVDSMKLAASGKIRRASPAA